MQNRCLNIALAVSGLLFLLLVSRAESPASQLSKADSLFQLKKYTQSLELYAALFNQQHYSQAMLLRMAFIEEGLSRYADAIYYLNLYYNRTFDEAAMAKIKELASANNFSGYEQTDMDKMALAWRRYGHLVTLVLTSIAFLLTLLLLIMAKEKVRRKSIWLAQSSVLLLLLIHLNYPFEKEAIILNDTAYLMSGPSAGASVVAEISEGHRVKVLGKEDVWVKIKWKNRSVFVRESNVKSLEF
jgi:hypothetical protein